MNDSSIVINMLGSQKIMSKIQEITGSACYLEEWMKTVKEIAEGFKVGFLSIGIRRVEEHVRG